MNLIITADLHLRSSLPRCRLDPDWIATQKNILDQIYQYSITYDASVVVVGDIFHSVNETTNEIIGIIQKFAIKLGDSNNRLYILAGNHDLPAHNLDNMKKSAFNVLLNSQNIKHLSELEIYDYKISASDFGDNDTNDADIAFKHILTFPNRNAVPPGAVGAVTARDLFDMFPEAFVIFTGDYHRDFIYKHKNSVAINPGCVIRQAADLIDYAPSVVLVEFKPKNRICKARSLMLKDNSSFITDDYIVKAEERSERIGAFVERIKTNESVSFDFVENVHNKLKNSEITNSVRETIIELLEGV
jgi:DNA repair exonuclease SbcCD nuclease subunit